MKIVFVFIFLFSISFFSCSDGEGDGFGPCSGVTCSGHGTCFSEEDGYASCNCDEGYVSKGFSCIQDSRCSGVTCSGHGKCYINEKNETACKCDEGYMDIGYDCIKDCDHECDRIDDKECSGDSVFVCGDYDNDGCREFRIEKECDEGCHNGHCIECHSRFDCPDRIKQYCRDKMCETDTIWADVDVVFDKQFEKSFLGSGYDAHFNGKSGLIRLQYGYNVLMFTVLTDTPKGVVNLVESEYPSINISLSNSDFPARVEGMYSSVGGTINFTLVDIRHGGAVAGEIDAVLKGGSNVDNPIEAFMKGAFYAKFPE